MTTLAQLHTDQIRRFDRNAFTYRRLLKKGKGWIAKGFLIRAERNQEAAEDALAMIKGERNA